MLMYHRIRSDRCPIPSGSRDELRYSVTLDTFREQMDCMLRLGYRGVAVGEVIGQLATDNVPGSVRRR